MAGDTTARVEILLRLADRATLGEAAKLRQQSLAQYLTEALECTAANLRQAQRVRLTPEDVWARRAEPESKSEREAEAKRWQRVSAAGNIL